MEPAGLQYINIMNIEHHSATALKTQDWKTRERIFDFVSYSHQC